MSIKPPDGEDVKSGCDATLVLECAPAPRRNDVKEE
jgi:hypothetical protein